MSPVKLHIGCASVRLDGYLNLDCRKTEATDFVCQADFISVARPGSVCEIYLRHMFEHLVRNVARKALIHWLDLLVPGGLVQIIVPDIEFHAHQLLGQAVSNFEDQQSHAFAGFWGWRDESRGGNREDAHRWGYIERSLKQLLAECGYVSIRRLHKGIDTEPWHLNIVAYKEDSNSSSIPDLGEAE